MRDEAIPTVRLAEARPAATSETMPLLHDALVVPARSLCTLARASAAPDATAGKRLLGEHVRVAYIAAHLTQGDLAGPDYSKSYISAVERGKLTPSFQALGILAGRLV